MELCLFCKEAATFPSARGKQTLEGEEGREGVKDSQMEGRRSAAQQLKLELREGGGRAWGRNRSKNLLGRAEIANFRGG